MKILFLTRRFYPEIGGVEKHVLEISKRLVSRGHEVKVITEFSPKNQNSKKNGYQSIGQSDTYDINSRQPAKSIQTHHFELDGIKVFRLKFGKNDRFKKFRIWSSLLEHLKLIKEADIVHCHDVFFWYLPFRFLFPLKKVFTTFHGYETKFPPAQGAIFIRRLSHFLSSGSIAIGSYIEKWYGTKSNFILYGGVDVEGKTQNKKLKTKNSKLKILFVGRIDEDNGIHVYIQALKLLKTKGIRFDFIACGDGGEKKSFQRFGRVLGFVRDVNKYIQSSDIVFASSYLSIMEALAAKKPVFSVYGNALKRDYLASSPFAKFIIIGSTANELEAGMTNLDHEKVKEGSRWAKKQSWDKVCEAYFKLWKI